MSAAFHSKHESYAILSFRKIGSLVACLFAWQQQTIEGQIHTKLLACVGLLVSGVCV